jgi:hypothetical protein
MLCLETLTVAETVYHKSGLSNFKLLRGRLETGCITPLFYCCMLDRVYGAVAWQCVDQIRYNANTNICPAIIRHMKHRRTKENLPHEIQKHLFEFYVL